MKLTLTPDLNEIEILVRNVFSMCDTNLCGALELIDIAFKGKNVPFLDYCVRESIMHTRRQCTSKEKAVFE